MSPGNETTGVPEPSLTRDAINLVQFHLWRTSVWARPYFGGRHGLLLAAVALLGLGAALNWSWLVAIGVVPVLVALAPCAAMCALGLCMSRMGGKSCSTDSPADNVEALPRATTAVDADRPDQSQAVASAEAAATLAGEGAGTEVRPAASGDPTLDERS